MEFLRKHRDWIRAAAVPALLVLAGAVCMVLFSRWAVSRSEDRAYQALQETARLESAAVETAVEGQYDVLEAFAGALAQQGLRQTEETRLRMQGIVEQTDLEHVCIAGPDGAAFNDMGYAFSIADRAYFSAALAGEREMELVPEARPDGMGQFVLSVPILADGKPVGAVAGAYAPVFFAGLLGTAGDAAGGYYICDTEGVVLASGGGSLSEGDSVITVLELRGQAADGALQALANGLRSGTAGVLRYTLDGEARCAIYQPMAAKGWSIICTAPVAAVEAEVQEAARIGTLQTLCVLICALLMFFWLISSQRAHERQLELYRVAADSGVFIVRMDEGRTLLYGNDRYYAIHGYTPEGMRAALNNQCARYVAEEDRERVHELLVNAQRAAQDPRWTMRIITGDGQTKTLLVAARFEWRQSGAVLRGVVTDITAQQAAQQELSVRQQMVELILQNTDLSIWEYDVEAAAILQSKDCREFPGMPREITNIPERFIEAGRIHPESVETVRNLYAALGRGEEQVEAVFRVRGNDGGWRYDRVRYTNLLEDGRPYRAVGLREDVTALYEQVASYQRELQYKQVQTPAAFGTALFNITHGQVLDVRGLDSLPDDAEGGMEQWLHMQAGRVAEDESIRRWFLNVTAKSLEEEHRAGNNRINMEYLRNNEDGLREWASCELHLVPDPGAGDLMLFLYLKKLDLGQQEVRRLREAVDQDSMTGLYNHDGMLRRVDRFLSMEGNLGTHALFMLDLDNFKQVNDTFGHQRGDSLLVETAQAIRGVFRDSDLIGRVGGDEFLVLMKNVDSGQMVARKAAELIQTLQFTITAGERSLFLSASVGAAWCAGGQRGAQEYYAEADAALYKAKSAGKNRFYFAGEAGGAPQLVVRGSSAAEAANTVQLRALLEYMNGGVVLLEIGSEVRQIYVSPSYCRMMECAFEGYELPRPLAPFIHTEDWPEYEAALRRGAEDGQVVDWIFRSARQGAGWRWRHVRAVRIPYQDSPLPVLIAVVTDITEQHESAAKLRAILDNSPAGIAVAEVREKLSLTFFNDEFARMLGMDREEAQRRIAGDAMAYVLDEEQARFRKELDSALAEDRPFHHTMTVRSMTAGHTRYFAVRAVRTDTAPDGAPIMMAMFIDNTEQMQLEQALTESRTALVRGNERLRLAFDQTSSILWEADVPSRIFACWDVERQRYDEKTVHHDVPDSLLESGVVHPDSAEELRTFAASMEAGEREGSCALLIRRVGEEEYDWAGVSYHMTYDRDGAPARAIGVLREMPNISDKRALFLQERKLIAALRPGQLATLRVNLTRDRVEKAWCQEDAVTARFDGQSHDSIFERCAEQVYNESDRAAFRQRFSREALADAWRDGVTWAGMEYRRRLPDGGVRWTAVYVLLMTEPVSGDLYAFGYMRDVDRRKYWELALPGRAEHDAATQLFTRETLLSAMGCALESGAPLHRACAVAALELRGLQGLAERLGVPAQNQLLNDLGRVMRGLWDGPALLCRDSACGFLIFFPEAADEAAGRAMALRAVESLRSVCAETGVLRGLELQFGLAAAPCGAMNAGELRLRAQGDLRRRAAGAEQEEEQVTAEAVIREDVRRDAQTGLLSRQAYYDMMSTLRPEALSAVGALFADINALGRLNRTFGNRYGDLMISYVADALRRTFGADCVYRVSGDEFLALRAGLAQDEFLALCARARQLCEESYPGGVSLGWTWNESVSSLQKLVDHAQEMMLNDKRAQHRAADGAVSAASRQLREWLEEGIEHDRFLVYLQPKADTVTGAVTGAEALVRYRGADGALQTPDRFIAQLEREGLIPRLDFHMLKCVLALLEEQRRRGRPLRPVSVNFSRLTMLHPGALEEVRRIESDYADLRPYVEIEVTERIGALERGTVTHACEQFRQEGYRLALDDFGSEYSSLYILSALRFDTIKIDKSVIDDLVASRMSRLVVETTLHICGEMGIVCVAEGVETEEQRAILRELGCPVIQGYLINKPLPAAEWVEKYLPPAVQ